MHSNGLRGKVMRLHKLFILQSATSPVPALSTLAVAHMSPQPHQNPILVTLRQDVSSLEKLNHFREKENL